MPTDTFQISQMLTRDFRYFPPQRIFTHFFFTIPIFGRVKRSVLLKKKIYLLIYFWEAILNLF